MSKYNFASLEDSFEEVLAGRIDWRETENNKIKYEIKGLKERIRLWKNKLEKSKKELQKDKDCLNAIYVYRKIERGEIK
jgi:hypothetical protein